MDNYNDTLKKINNIKINKLKIVNKISINQAKNCKIWDVHDTL